MAGTRDRLLRAFREAEATFRLDSWLGREPLIAASVDLLAAGVATHGVIALAGDDHATDEEISTDLDRALADLGLAALTPADGAAVAARPIAVALLAGAIDARAAASRILDLWYRSDYAGGALGELAQVAEGFEIGDYVSTEDKLRAAAAAFVSQAPTG